MPAVQSTRVVQEMEAAILSGAFKPRERLVEMDLISRYGVSRTVIREALKRLETRGLIRMTPYRFAATPRSSTILVEMDQGLAKNYQFVLHQLAGGEHKCVHAPASKGCVYTRVKVVSQL